MILSPREQIIISELLAHDTPLSVNQFMALLKVSRRTVYRELDYVGETLKQLGARLETPSRGHFLIQADDTIRKKLTAILMTDEPIDFSTVSRQRGILLDVLLTDEPLSLNYFLETYGISNTTFYGDIKQLEEQLVTSPLTLERNQGYEMIGSEKYRRLLIANILGSEINEYQFFHFEELSQVDRYFFEYVSASYVTFAQKVVKKELEDASLSLSDRKLQHLMLLLTLSMDRVATGHFLVEDMYSELINKDMLNVSKKIYSKVGIETKQLYPVNEIVFFASLLSDFSSSFEDDFFDDSFDTRLAYLVKRLIEQVSQETEISFYEDANLYTMLLTHLSGVFSRAILQDEVLTNPILEKIMEQYSDIAMAIRGALKDVFPENQLSEEEIAYMVIHFANSLERSPKIIEVDIAGFSPSGLASTSMLEMKLRHHFPFINAIHFYSVSEVTDIPLDTRYDVIISTSLLPGFKGHYLLVSPLLLEDEVKLLKKEFKQISRHKKVVKHQPMNEKVEGNPYERMRQLMESVNDLLSRFFVDEQIKGETIEACLGHMLSKLPGDWVKNRTIVEQQLIKRMAQAPVGLPGTTMALIHTASQEVKVPLFCVFDLAQPLLIQGMDKENMSLHRVLLMLAPENMNERDLSLLGKISGAIIMNDLNLEIFNSGNEAIIYQLLTALLIEEMT